MSACHFDVIATKYNSTTTTVDDNNHNEEANNDNWTHHNNNNYDNDNATPNSLQLRWRGPSQGAAPGRGAQAGQIRSFVSYDS